MHRQEAAVGAGLGVSRDRVGWEGGQSRRGRGGCPTASAPDPAELGTGSWGYAVCSRWTSRAVLPSGLPVCEPTGAGPTPPHLSRGRQSGKSAWPPTQSPSVSPSWQNLRTGKFCIRQIPYFTSTENREDSAMATPTQSCFSGSQQGDDLPWRPHSDLRAFDSFSSRLTRILNENCSQQTAAVKETR